MFFDVGPLDNNFIELCLHESLICDSAAAVWVPVNRVWGKMPP